MIENRKEKLKKIEIDSEYKSLMMVFNVEIDRKYHEVNNAFYPVVVVLLIASKIGIERTKEIEDLVLSCSLIFSNIEYPYEAYSEYYDCLKLIYDHDKNNVKVEKKDYIYAKEKVRILNKEFDGLYEGIDQRPIKPTVALKKLFYMIPDKDIFTSVCVFSELKEIFERFNELLVKIQDEKELKIKNKDISKMRSKVFNTTGKEYVKDIDDIYHTIRSKYLSLISENQRKNKANNRIKNLYDDLLIRLARHNGYIDNIKQYTNLIEDEDILNEFLKYVIYHNAQFEEQVKNKNNELKSKQISNIELLFNKYGYNLSELSYENIVSISNIDNLEEKLYLIKNSSFNNLKVNDYLFMLIILNCNVKQINYLSYLYKEKIIDRSFLIENKDIFTNENIYNNFKLNISYLNKIIYGIVKYDRNILMIDNSLIVKRYKLMNDNYNIKVNTFDNFEFLKNDQIFDLLDNFIELGYYNQILNNPNYLVSSNFTAIKRLQVSKLINLNVVNSDNSFIGSIITGDNFYIPDNKLDDFIIDYADKYISCDNFINIDISDSDYGYISKLENYYYDSVSYKINDKIISKNRILRNINVLKEGNSSEEALLKAIIFKSIDLAEDDISTIYNLTSIKLKSKCLFNNSNN